MSDPLAARGDAADLVWATSAAFIDLGKRGSILRPATHWTWASESHMYSEEAGRILLCKAEFA